MASHPKVDEPLPPAGDERNPYASATRWRHQESSAYARHAAAADPHAKPTNTRDLASFLNSSRVPPEETRDAETHDANGAGRYQPIMIAAGEATGAEGERPPDTVTQPATNSNEVACGPLLNYRNSVGNTWYGSVLIVMKGGGQNPGTPPTLIIGRSSAASSQGGFVEGQTSSAANEFNSSALNGHTEETNSASPETVGSGTDVQGICLYSDPRNTFWQFPIACAIGQTETKWEYFIRGVNYSSPTKTHKHYFYVPAINESMRIMFHSCNGFSVGTDEEAWSGPALWNDVLRRHAVAPFHVMLGGGDQIYNDGIRVSGPLREWTDIGNPKKRREYKFPEQLRQACDDYYLNNYIRWYSTEPFASANGQIAQLNIWDDHDIIDGFGSYVNEFMKCDVFRGIGGTAHKYYMLFQHHLAPPKSTYTTDALQTLTAGDNKDPNQLMDTHVAEYKSEPNYIIGRTPGPYVAEHSHSMFAKLGARVAFLGIDARTERTRHQVNYPETYDLIFDRLKHELGSAAASGQPFKHLILLLGIPIAYPRLTWLENVFSSPLIGPIKFLNRRFGLGGGVFNHFDGSVDLLDDLDDHYTARTHKKERNRLIQRLQTIAAEHSVRITILGGDVHLAALGRFYSNPNLHIPTDADHRYMANVVSSAIVNKPPPQAIANLLAKRNKIHHLDVDTDETLMKLFNKDPGDSNKTASSNKVTMPSRNFAILTENSPNNTAVANGDGHLAVDGSNNGTGADSTPAKNVFDGKDGHDFLNAFESGAGTQHRAASELHGGLNDGSLDICIRVEMDQHDKEGKTEGYGLTVPVLNYKAGAYPSNPPRHLPHSRASSRPTTANNSAAQTADH